MVVMHVHYSLLPVVLLVLLTVKIIFLITLSVYRSWFRQVRAFPQRRGKSEVIFLGGDIVLEIFRVCSLSLLATKIASATSFTAQYTAAPTSEIFDIGQR